MWGSLGKNVQGFVGAALENVTKISKELEAEMNAAVSIENENIPIEKDEKTKEKVKEVIQFFSSSSSFIFISFDSLPSRKSTK